MTYVVGMATLYACLGLVAGLSGTLFGAVSANPWALLAIGNLLLLFSLFMLEVFPIPMPRRLMDWAATREGGSYGAVFLLGAGSGIVAAPCGAPALRPASKLAVRVCRTEGFSSASSLRQ